MYLFISLISNIFPCHSWNSSKYFFPFSFGMTSVENRGGESDVWCCKCAITHNLLDFESVSSPDAQFNPSIHWKWRAKSKLHSTTCFIHTLSPPDKTSAQKKRKLHTWKQPHPDQLTPNENFCRRNTPPPPHVWQENKDMKKKIKALFVSPVLIRFRLSPALVRAQQQWIQIGTDWLLPKRKSSRAVRCSGLVKSHTHRYAHWGRKCLLTIKASMWWHRWRSSWIKPRWLLRWKMRFQCLLYIVMTVYDEATNIYSLRAPMVTRT